MLSLVGRLIAFAAGHARGGVTATRGHFFVTVVVSVSLTGLAGHVSVFSFRLDESADQVVDVLAGAFGGVQLGRQVIAQGASLGDFARCVGLSHRE